MRVFRSVVTTLACIATIMLSLYMIELADGVGLSRSSFIWYESLSSFRIAVENNSNIHRGNEHLGTGLWMVR